MRIIVMGTGPFCVPSAERIRAAGHDIPLVVTRPVADPRAKKQPPRPMFDWAAKHGLAVFEPLSINEEAALRKLQDVGADLYFVCDYGQILSNACLSLPRLGGINLHGSILPRHRGAAPVQWALLRGDTLAGVTVIHMTPRLDAGPALQVATLPIGRDETAEELEPRLAEIGTETTMNAIEQLSDWDQTGELGEIQDKSLVTKAPRFSKSHGILDFRLSANYLSRLVKACQPWPGTFADIMYPDGKTMRVIIRSARAVDTTTEKLAHSDLGTVVEFEQAEEPTPWRKVIAVRTGNGVLLVSRIQPAGKRAMEVEEFLRGHPITDTARFLLPEHPVAPLCD